MMVYIADTMNLALPTIMCFHAVVAGGQLTLCTDFKQYCLQRSRK